jgi:MoxR-like ATPase
MKPMTFSISMGVRTHDKALADEINRILERRQSDIQRILAEFHIQSSGPSKSATAE